MARLPVAVGRRDALYPERTPVDCHALLAADVGQIARGESSARSRSLRRPVLLQGVTAEVNATSNRGDAKNGLSFSGL